MGRVWSVAAGIATLVVGIQILHLTLSLPGSNDTPVLKLPSQLGGWQQSAQLPSDWAPAYVNANVSQHVGYARDGQSVAVWVGFYRDQGPRRQLISSVNNLVASTSHSWTQVSTGTHQLSSHGGLKVAWAVLRDTADPNAPARTRLKVWRLYWVNGQFTASPVRAKALMAWQRLRGGGDDSAAVVLYTVMKPGDNSDTVLDDFFASHLDALAATLQAASAGR